jgi:hypothetical protein
MLVFLKHSGFAFRDMNSHRGTFRQENVQWDPVIAVSLRVRSTGSLVCFAAAVTTRGLSLLQSFFACFTDVSNWGQRSCPFLLRPVIIVYSLEHMLATTYLLVYSPEWHLRSVVSSDSGRSDGFECTYI